MANEITFRREENEEQVIIIAECGDASALYVVGEGYSSNPADTDDCPATEDECWPIPPAELRQHTMKTMTDLELTEQGARIVTAIEAGIAAMTPQRWREEAAKAAAFDDDGEWFAPEFAAARVATEGIVWEFSGWREALDIIVAGYGKLGGVTLVIL